MGERDPSLMLLISEAVASGEFGRARALWIELGSSLQRELVAGGLTAARLHQTRELLDWCRTQAIVECAERHWFADY